jgi:hypothetical protein
VADKNQKSGAAAHKSLQNETSRTRIQVGKCQHGGTKALNHAVSSSGSDSELSDSSKIVDMTPGVISGAPSKEHQTRIEDSRNFKKSFPERESPMIHSKNDPCSGLESITEDVRLKSPYNEELE